MTQTDDRPASTALRSAAVDPAVEPGPPTPATRPLTAQDAADLLGPLFVALPFVLIARALVREAARR